MGQITIQKEDDESRLKSLVCRMAVAMEHDLLRCYANGKTGWDEPAERHFLELELREHTDREEWVGVANLAAMLWNITALDGGGKGCKTGASGPAIRDSEAQRTRPAPSSDLGTESGGGPDDKGVPEQSANDSPQKPATLSDCDGAGHTLP